MALLPYPIKLLLSELPTFLDLATFIFLMFHNLFGYLSSFLFFMSFQGIGLRSLQSARHQ